MYKITRENGQETLMNHLDGVMEEFSNSLGSNKIVKIERAEEPTKGFIKIDGDLSGENIKHCIKTGCDKFEGDWLKEERKASEKMANMLNQSHKNRKPLISKKEENLLDLFTCLEINHKCGNAEINNILLKKIKELLEEQENDWPDEPFNLQK